MIADESGQEKPSTTAMMASSSMPGHGCNIEGQFYMDGMQVIFINQYSIMPHYGLSVENRHYLETKMHFHS